MSGFGAGANVDGKHYFGRDVELAQVEDTRNVVEGDLIALWSRYYPT